MHHVQNPEVLQTGQIVEPFLLGITFGCSSATVLVAPAVQTLQRMRGEEPKRLAALKHWALLRLAIGRLLFRTRSAQPVWLPQGKVLAWFPRTPILFQESEIDWRCFPRPRACALSVPSPRSLPHGAYEVRHPACALVGKGVTISLTSANPAGRAKGQQSLTLTRSVAVGTWEWLSPSHPPRPTYKTGKEFSCIPQHAPDKDTEEVGCGSPVHWATLIPRGENKWISPVLQINSSSAILLIFTKSVCCIRWK